MYKQRYHSTNVAKFSYREVYIMLFNKRSELYKIAFQEIIMTLTIYCNASNTPQGGNKVGEIMNGNLVKTSRKFGPLCYNIYLFCRGGMSWLFPHTNIEEGVSSM